MVSNDDIMLPVEKNNVKPILVTGATGTGAWGVNYTVPAGKRWRLRAASLERDVSGIMRLELIEPEIAGVQNDVILARVTDVILTYKPYIISITAGWVIRCYFGATATSGLMVAKILYDEEIEY